MSDTAPRVGIYTLGCKVNQYESEAIAEELEKHGVCILPPTDVCDAYIINTCTVTAESDRKARQFIRRAMRENPDAFVVVTGCVAQTAPDGLCAIKGVDSIVGNTEKMAAAREVLRLLSKKKKAQQPTLLVSDIDTAPFEPMTITHFDRTRAYVKIEDGCESRCTYCIIPSARGKIRSKPMNEVLSEVAALTAGGCREVVLTGIETASWGKDLPEGDLAALLERVDSLAGIGRVRLGSLDPSLIRPDFVRRIASLSSLAPHFHLSLQSGSSSVLARMKRKYNAEQAMRAIHLLREAIKGVNFTTDVIVGFPGETEEEFSQTLAFVKEAKFLTVHAFPYSKRAGTPAASMPNQVPAEVKRRRMGELMAAAEESRRSICEEAVMGQPLTEVLFETLEDGLLRGHTASFLEIAVPSSLPLHGEIRTVRLTHTDGKICYGELVDMEMTEKKDFKKNSKKLLQFTLFCAIIDGANADTLSAVGSNRSF